MVAPLATYAPPAVASSVNGSGVLRAVSSVLPAPGQVISDLSRRLRVPTDLAGLAPTAYSVANTPTEVQLQGVGAQAASSVVSIHTSGSSEHTEGSGFAVGTGLVVTNWHIVSSASTITVTDQGGMYPARVVAADVDADVAVLRGTDSRRPR